MQLTGLHILLTYQCIFECDHCFVWGSPRQKGTLGVADLDKLLDQAQAADVEWVYFEGGEPFLYYPVMVHAVQRAAQMGLSAGIVTNAYWATSISDAIHWLQPLVGALQDLSVSSDMFHCEKSLGEGPQNAIAAAKLLNIPTDVLSVAQPGSPATQSLGQLEDESAVMFRGRAAEVLAPASLAEPWESLASCPHEDLRSPGRAHVDPLGYVHICQGIVIGNVFQRPLRDICANYDPDSHPICGVLLDGGPAALVTEFGLPHRATYADECHLCYEARLELRLRFPELLAPDQVYGVFR
jgi:MoaA/NifB/PqqE/SkfB family radical SAM enzyme